MTFQAPDRQTRRILWTTGALCVACCALPAIGLAIGSATLAGLAIYAEQAALAVLALGLAWLAWRRLLSKAAPACDIDCARGPGKATD